MRKEVHFAEAQETCHADRVNRVLLGLPGTGDVGLSEGESQ
jgi:hypothetical protein